MRVHLDDDPQVDETWLELTIQDLWDSVKRVRQRRGRCMETHVLTFGATTIEIEVRRMTP